jgi:hypothetical protein
MSRSHSSTGAFGSSKSTSSSAKAASGSAKAASGSSSQGGKDIYALVDPRSGKERYVGAAADPARRLDAHIREARGRCETEKCQWIRELDREGLRPRVKHLASASAEEWRAVERAHIDRRQGLTNTGAETQSSQPDVGAWWQFWK